MYRQTIASASIALALATSATAGQGCGKAYGAMTAHPAGYAHPTSYVQPVGYYGSGYQHKQMKQPVAQADPDIVDIAVSAGSFNTLVTAVKAAGLVETLKGDGPFTVFAPTDEAFAKLPEGTLEALLEDKEKLTQILTYHVVPGKVDSNAVGGISKLATVEGSELAVADIKLAKTDIMASNGVIHVINEVLIPGS